MYVILEGNGIFSQHLQQFEFGMKYLPKYVAKIDCHLCVIYKCHQNSSFSDFTKYIL